jgi:putative transposase
MTRKLRMYLPDVPCHIIQRGNNRDATFLLSRTIFFILNAYVMR